MIHKEVLILVSLAVICHAALANATCRDAELQVGEDTIKALERYVKLTIRNRFEAQTRKFVFDSELVMETKFNKKVDGITAYYTIHGIEGSEDDPNYKHVYLNVIDEKTGKRELTKKHVEDLLENVLAKKCRAYVAAVKEPLRHATQDKTCYLDMNYRVHLCEMLSNKQNKIAKVMFEKATNVVLPS